MVNLSMAPNIFHYFHVQLRTWDYIEINYEVWPRGANNVVLSLL
jgi:hypothetical protein